MTKERRRRPRKEQEEKNNDLMDDDEILRCLFRVHCVYRVNVSVVM